MAFNTTEPNLPDNTPSNPITPSSDPTPAPAISKMSSRPNWSPRMVALVLRTPYDNPWLMDSTAPEPGDTAIRQDAAKKASQVWKSMNAP